MQIIFKDDDAASFAASRRFPVPSTRPVRAVQRSRRVLARVLSPYGLLYTRCVKDSRSLGADSSRGYVREKWYMREGRVAGG